MIVTDRPTTFSRDDRRRFREKVRCGLGVFAQVLDQFRFDPHTRMVGLELELDLVDGTGVPAMRNAEFLTALCDPAFKAELGAYNVEINITPRLIGGSGFADFEADLRGRLAAASAVAAPMDLRLVLTGILPTVAPSHTVRDNMSRRSRYRILNDQTIDIRGDDITLDIRGPEHLRMAFDSVMAESANTSLQIHLQLSPDSFAGYWNASQAIAGVQVAVGANSPFLYGRRLWDETRIPLFEQAVDERPAELRNQGVRPRVWFGERWVTSIFDLFEENLRYFGVLLPTCDDEDPEAVFAAGGVPSLFELRLHNGTIYRWNRPVYDVTNGRPHVRVENRVLPSGPTVADMLANVAFYAGLARALAESDRPVWTQLPYTAAAENFQRGSRYGLGASLFWPGEGDTPVRDLVLRRLLPVAHAGLDSLAVDPSTRDRLLGIIEGRCATGHNGATWQSATVAHLEARGSGRRAALGEMLMRYLTLTETNEPVHTWPIG